MDVLSANIRRATDALFKAQMRQVAEMDKHRRLSPFKVGDKVMLSTQNLSFSSSPKFTPRFVGSFVIVALRSSGNAAELCFKDYPDFRRRGVHPVFNVSLLRMFVDRPASLGPVRVNRPPALAIDENDASWFAVDKIVKQEMRGRGVKRCLHYLVRWQGYGALDDTWEPATQIAQDCPEAVQEFIAAHRQPLNNKP